MVFAQETFLGTGSARCELIFRQGARVRGGGRSPRSAVLYAKSLAPQQPSACLGLGA